MDWTASVCSSLRQISLVEQTFFKDETSDCYWPVVIIQKTHEHREKLQQRLTGLAANSTGRRNIYCFGSRTCFPSSKNNVSFSEYALPSCQMKLSPVQRRESQLAIPKAQIARDPASSIRLISVYRMTFAEGLFVILNIASLDAIQLLQTEFIPKIGSPQILSSLHVSYLLVF